MTAGFKNFLAQTLKILEPTLPTMLRYARLEVCESRDFHDMNS